MPPVINSEPPSDPTSTADKPLQKPSIPPAPSNYVFACRTHGVFTSPTTSEHPPCCDPLHPYGTRFDPNFPSRARHTLGSDNRYAFLAATPKTLPWDDSSWLGRLKLIPGTYIERFDSGRWGLKTSIQNDWENLEQNLWAIAQRLELHIPLAQLDTQPCPLPRSYGYLRLHRTHAIVERVIEKSLDGFLVLIGYCSFLILRRNRKLCDTDTDTDSR